MKKLFLFLVFAIGSSACVHTGGLSEIDPTGIYQLVGDKDAVCVEVDDYGVAPVKCDQYEYVHIIDILNDPPKNYYSNKESIVLGMIFRESTVHDNH